MVDPFRICLMATLTVAVFLVEPGVAEKPFRAIWNYPDRSCRSLGVDFNLSNYSIESNSQGQGFIGDTVALYYSGQAGKWPHVEFGEDTDNLINGGWPHKFALAPHLKHLRKVISAHQSPDSSGFGVIDMELWRPILRTNYGAFEPYRTKFMEYVNKTYPGMQSTREIRLKAEKVWRASAKRLMLASLKAAKLIRPNAHWGYYRYPEHVTVKDNHKLEWLWKEVTAYYPSIYIHNYTHPVKEMEDMVTQTIAEAYRVRALYGNPRNPIMAYVNVQTIPEENRDEWLRLQLQVPFDMGVDGVILWASSSSFTPDPATRCLEMKRYIRDTVGPYIIRLTKEANACSERLCSNRGRCVKKTYAKDIPHLVTTNSTGLGGTVLLESLMSGKEYYANFQCQCYSDWGGERCSDVKTN